MTAGWLLCLALVALGAPRLARADRIAGLSAKEFSRDVLDENWTLGPGASTGLMEGGIPVAQLKAAGPTAGDVATMWSKGTYDLRELSSILTLAVEGEGGGSRFSWIFANDPADGSTRGATHGMHAIDLGQPEHWIGFALEFNLVQGSEHDPAHRDVRIVLGGSSSAAQQDTTNSCKVNFSFEKVMAKLMVYQRTLFVFTSEHADLNWQECAVVPLDNLAPEALSAGRVGFQSDGLAGKWDQGRAQMVSVVSMDTDSRWDMAGSRPLEDHRSEGSAPGVEGRGEWQSFGGHMDGQAPDIHSGTFTVKGAQEWCEPRADCHGFTFNAAEVDEAAGEYEMHFKTTTAWSTSADWHTYIQGHLEAKRHGADPAEQAQDAKVRNMKLHEWGTEQRIKMLEESINDRIVARVDSLEQSVEDTLDSNLVSRIGELEQIVIGTAQTKLTERIRVLETEYQHEVEEKLTKHVDELEKRVDLHFEGTSAELNGGMTHEMESRLVVLEAAVKKSMEDKISGAVRDAGEKTRTWVGQVAQKLDKRADDSIAQMQEQVTGDVAAGGGWQLPFAGLCVVLAVVFVGFAKWHKEQQKNHLL